MTEPNATVTTASSTAPKFSSSTATPGFSRGRNLDKVGQHAGDTSELFFAGMRVPADALLGGVEGQGFVQMMRELARERLIIGVQAVQAVSALKLHTTALCSRVADHCLQLFGGYGYMAEYPISRFWADARVLRIYGGTSEIMKELVARSLLGR